MSRTPTLAVVYFGDGKYQQHLERWARCYRASGTKLPAIVITDKVSKMPHNLGIPSLVVDPHPYNDLVRPLSPGQVWDYKGALILAALPKLGPVLVTDADCEILRDPAPLLETIAKEPLMLALDSGSCVITTRRGDSLLERNGGVIWFGSNGHNNVGLDYYSTFLELELNGLKNARCDLLEQDAWSVMHHRRKAPLLPKELNWQGHFWGPSDQTVIRHLHGGKEGVTEAVRPLPSPHRNRFIVIGTPHQGSPTQAYLDARDAFVAGLPEGVDVVINTASGGIVKARNEICANVLRHGADGCLMWDADVIANARDVIRLVQYGLDEDYDVIGGLYALKAHPSRWIMSELNERPQANANGVLEVYEIGTGLKWISRRALVTMQRKLPDIFYWSDDMHAKNEPRWNFNAMGVYDKRFLTEDFAFDFLAHAAGLKVYADTKCVCGHRGSIIYPLSPLPIPGTPKPLPEPVEVALPP